MWKQIWATTSNTQGYSQKPLLVGLCSGVAIIEKSLALHKGKHRPGEKLKHISCMQLILFDPWYHTDPQASPNAA